MVDIRPLSGSASSYAQAVNDNGAVVGWAAGEETHAFVWTQSGGFVELSAEFSDAHDINNAGAIVGEEFHSEVTYPAYHATIWIPFVVATTMESCQGTNWQNVRRADGTTFKNRGECIQYVRTSK